MFPIQTTNHKIDIHRGSISNLNLTSLHKKWIFLTTSQLWLPKSVSLTISHRQFQKTKRRKTNKKKNNSNFSTIQNLSRRGVDSGDYQIKNTKTSISWKTKFLNYQMSNSNYRLFMFPISNAKHKIDTSRLPLTFQLDLPDQKMSLFNYIPTLLAKNCPFNDIASSIPKNETTKNKQEKRTKTSQQNTIYHEGALIRGNTP